LFINDFELFIKNIKYYIFKKLRDYKICTNDEIAYTDSKTYHESHNIEELYYSTISSNIIKI